MAKQHPTLESDERGFLTLPLPQPGLLDHLPLWAHHLPHPRLNPKLRHHLLQGAVGLSGFLTVFLLAGFFMPSSLQFSFGTTTCAFNPQLLPKLTKHQANGSFTAESPASLSIGKYPLFSHQTCITASQAPSAQEKATLKLSPLGLPLIHKNMSVSVDALPMPSAQPVAAAEIATSGELMFDFTESDRVFSYQVSANKLTAPCSINGTSLGCSLEPLALKPGTIYEYKLERLFAGSSLEEIVKSSFTTLDPVVLTKSSIKNKATAYNKPTKVTLTFNKPLASAENVQFTDQEITWTIKDTKLSVTFTKELPREKSFELSIGKLVATDGSQPLKPLRHTFKTSGGPKVTGSSIGSSRVSSNATIALNFDSPLLASQKLANYASLEVGGKSVSTSLSLDGNRLYINPVSDLPRCTSFTVRVKAGLTNKYQVGNGSAWSMQSRTLCQVAFSIGSSVQGRSIMAYRFGSGASRVVFVGGTHGNEQSSYYTLTSLIDHLESNPGLVPGHRSVIIIPNLNPDGFARNSRTNANTVDLNRNFPSNDWQKSIQMPGGITLPKGGGNAPLDQPESKALAQYIQNINPRLVLTYHAVARVVISNDVDDSVALGKKYASASDYSFTSNANSHGTFEYATTGEFEDWLADKRDVPALLIELGYMYSSEFHNHRHAMIQMIQLP